MTSQPVSFYDHHKSRLVETMTFWAEYHGGFKGFSPNEFFEWDDSHPLCSNALSPGGSMMITITITIITRWCATFFFLAKFLDFLCTSILVNCVFVEQI